MITAVDTNILLDLLIPETSHAAESKAWLDGSNALGSIIISEVVYAELAAQFASFEELQKFLLDTGIRLENMQPAALQAASNAWRAYTSRRNRAIQCPLCGHYQNVSCASCGSSITIRQHVLADFLIGGHALTQADSLLTRDRGYYRTYFPDLRVHP